MHEPSPNVNRLSNRAVSLYLCHLGLVIAHCSLMNEQLRTLAYLGEYLCWLGVARKPKHTQFLVQPVDGSEGDVITHTILHPSRWSITTPQAWVLCLTSTVVRAFSPTDLHILKSFQSPPIRVNCKGDPTLGSSLPACPPVVYARAENYKWGQRRAC